MLQGQGRQVCVRDQVGNGLPITQHLLKHLPMALRGTHNPRYGLFEPTLYATERLVEGKWIFKDVRITGAPLPQPGRAAPGYCPDFFLLSIPVCEPVYDKVAVLRAPRPRSDRHEAPHSPRVGTGCEAFPQRLSPGPVRHHQGSVWFACRHHSITRYGVKASSHCGRNRVILRCLRRILCSKLLCVFHLHSSRSVISYSLTGRIPVSLT